MQKVNVKNNSIQFDFDCNVVNEKDMRVKFINLKTYKFYVISNFQPII